MAVQPAQSAGSARRDLSGDALAQEVFERFAQTEPARFRELMQALVRHLHAFAREVQLTEDEWFAAIQFLTRVGQTCTDTRQEMIMLSDVLGLSMQVIGINHPAVDGSTESTVFGPFYIADPKVYPNGADLANGAVGQPCYVTGQVRSTTGDPIPGAVLDIWQADEEGLYDVQRPDLTEPQGRGRLIAGADGRFSFWTVKPEPYPIPTDGPVGVLMHSANRSPMRPAHIHYMVSANGYQSVTTHVFSTGDPFLDVDAVFGVKQSLIGQFDRHDPGTAPDGRKLDQSYYTMEYDFVLAPASNGTA